MQKEEISLNTPIIIEKTLPADMTLKEFNKKFGANLSYEGAETINDLIYQILKHHPSQGESIYIDHFEITVIELTLLGAKTVNVKTIT